VQRYFVSVSGLQIIIGNSSDFQKRSTNLDEAFDLLVSMLDDFLSQLAKDGRIFGTAKERFPHTRFRRYYDNLGGVPAIAWLVTFTENNNFKNICTNDRF
jgi:hypothetical protein